MNEKTNTLIDTAGASRSEPDLLKRLECFRLAARRAGSRSRARGRRNRLPGGRTEATGLRDYAPGDDYRYIDWICCARRDELLTKTFEGDEDLHIYVLLDCSPSMGFGTPSKFELARRIAAALGYAALVDLDRFSVAAFSEAIVTDLTPIRGKAQMPRLLRFLEQLPLQAQPTDLERTAKAFVRRYQRHGPVVLISDLYDRAGFTSCLDMLRYRGYEPRVVQVHEPGEANPGLLGELELSDAEADVTQRVTITERSARRYLDLFAEFRDSVRDYCGRKAIACVQVACDAPEDDVLLKILRMGRQGSPLET